MPKAYEHSFNDLHSQDEVSAVDVDMSNKSVQRDATGATIINESPGNPDAGKADQFDDTRQIDTPTTVEEPFEVDLGGNEDTTVEDRPAKGDQFEERLGRERRMREEAEERSRRLEAQLGQLSSKIDIQQQERDIESANVKDREALAALKEQKIKAKEEGNTASEVDLDDKIIDLKSGMKSRESELARAKENLKKAGAAPAKVVNPKAQAWITAHPEYNSDPLFAEAARAADQLLYKLGFNQNSDEYYTRMSRTLAERFPDKIRPEYLKNKRGGKPGTGGVGSTGVRGGNSMSVTNSNPNKVTITQAEIQMLQQMGQDTSNPAVLREFARNKQSDQRAEAKGRQ